METNKTKIIDLYEEEKKKIAFLENLLKAIYRDKVVSEGESVKVSLSPKDMRDLIAAESELMALKRRVYGLDYK